MPRRTEPDAPSAGPLPAAVVASFPKCEHCGRHVPPDEPQPPQCRNHLDPIPT